MRTCARIFSTMRRCTVLKKLASGAALSAINHREKGPRAFNDLIQSDDPLGARSMPGTVRSESDLSLILVTHFLKSPRTPTHDCSALDTERQSESRYSCEAQRRRRAASSSSSSSSSGGDIATNDASGLTADTLYVSIYTRTQTQRLGSTCGAADESSVCAANRGRSSEIAVDDDSQHSSSSSSSSSSDPHLLLASSRTHYITHTQTEAGRVTDAHYYQRLCDRERLVLPIAPRKRKKYRKHVRSVICARSTCSAGARLRVVCEAPKYNCYHAGVRCHRRRCI
ncbi:unnamed protein product [Trichogramma brassicae]|uniref:Uncharacterized protein n=1 Tax=Trichogramma brassicae TaxID=86971 RepID=A0A6H5IDU5_9HYME|nr:unnamed protein product [Trichogramma brassicae]